MTLQLPRLDDRTYEQLADLLRRQLTSPEWTDHNASDPGIALLELLAWLGEMALYRMDRVPPSHRNKFLYFLIDPPEPVTIQAQLRATFGLAPATDAITVPAGTLLATDFRDGRRFVFETFEPVKLVRPAVAGPGEPLEQLRWVKARAILEVRDEELGMSDGGKHQEFQLMPSRTALGVADPAAPMPVLVDFVHRYDVNPVISDGTSVWTAVPSLLLETSRVATHPPARHFVVDQHANRIRFGDGVFGAIPPRDAVITCTRYVVLDPPATRDFDPLIWHPLRVVQGDVKHILRVPGPALPTDVGLQIVTNTDAEGGANFFPASERFRKGLQKFRAPYRLITERDFVRAVLQDFNEFLRLSRNTLVASQVLGLSVVFDRKPVTHTDGSVELVDAPSHVTLVPIVGDEHFEGNFRDHEISVITKQGMVTMPPALWARLQRFLDSRRLITTRLDRLTPRLRRVDITGTVVVAGERSVGDMQDALRARLYDFLSPLKGDFDGRGWRLGRNVYRSQVFRVLEETDGVDHVDTVTVSPANPEGNVEIAPHERPVLQTITIPVVRE